MDQNTLLLTMLESGLAHCTVTVEQNGGLLLSLFLAGFLGSASHCIGMCGPFVLSQVTARLEHTPVHKMSEFRRLTGAALLPYHFGRMTTYVALGAAAGLLAQGMIQFSGVNEISALLLIAASLFFLGYGLRRFGVSFPHMPIFGQKTQSAAKTSGFKGNWLKPFFARPVGWNGYVLGVGLGFLPCGLLYGALAAAGASGDILAGAFAMVAFALGTIPALIAVALLGHMAGQKWRTVITDLAPVLLIVNAGVLAYLAYSMLV